MTNLDEKEKDVVATELTEAERNLQADNNVPIYRFVFTGGPCGGKTTALARVFSYLRERNYEVINCPEAYTILSSNGMSTDFFTTSGMGHVIQGTVLDVQLALEEGVKRVLKARGKPAVILCDRGTMDGSVYISKDEFQKVMNERNTDVVQLRDNRYDACFHMVTAADGAEPYYTLENNQVRTESKEQARYMDKLTQRAWVGHPHLYILDNSTDFEGKMIRLVDIISKIVGLPSNLKRRSAKFVLNTRPLYTDFPSDIDFQIFEVEKVYLQQRVGTNSDNNYSFIRRRSNVDPETGKILGSVYQITTVQISPIKNNGEMIEQKRIITRREYDTAYQTSRDLNRYIIKQKRISFLYEKQSFTVHMYEEPVQNINILHAQVEAIKSNNNNNNNSTHSSSSDNNGDDDNNNNNNNNNTTDPDVATTVVQLPPFLNVGRKLENNDEDENMYGAYSISLIHKN